MTDDAAPSETSPLIPQSKSTLPQPADASNGALQKGVSSNGHAQEDNKSVDEEQAHGDEEGTERQYRGLPEAKKQLKYIVPAIAIGVRPIFPRKDVHQLTWKDLSVCLRSDHHRQ